MEQDSRQADIEITPEMVGAGIIALADNEPDDVGLDQCLRAVFWAMITQTVR